MSHALSRALFRLALTIAPKHRRPWMEAMAAEAEATGRDRMGWALGCVTTAMGERAGDLVVSGDLLRAVGGSFVVLMGLSLLAILINMNRYVQGHSLDAKTATNIATSAILVSGAMIGLIAAGLSVLFAAKSRVARIGGRVLFILGALAYSGLVTWSAGGGVAAEMRLDRPVHLATWLFLATVPLYLAMALGLLLKHARLVAIAGGLAIAVSLINLCLTFAHMHGARPEVIWISALMSAIPGLVVLSGCGLITGRALKPAA